MPPYVTAHRTADAYLAVFGVLPSPADDFCAGAGDAHSGGGSPSRSPPRAEGSDSGDDEDNAEEAAELRRVHSADGAHRMLALAQAMRSICALTQAPDGSGPIQIRLGLHVGPAVAAVVGTQMLRCARVRSGALAYRVCLDVSIWGVYIWRGCRSPLPASRSIPARPCWSNH